MPSLKSSSIKAFFCSAWSGAFLALAIAQVQPVSQMIALAYSLPLPPAETPHFSVGICVVVALALFVPAGWLTVPDFKAMASIIWPNIRPSDTPASNSRGN